VTPLYEPSHGCHDTLHLANSLCAYRKVRSSTVESILRFNCTNEGEEASAEEGGGVAGGGGGVWGGGSKVIECANKRVYG
jgi:hypothetical protein